MVLILLVINSVAMIVWGAWVIISPESHALWLLDLAEVDLTDVEEGFSSSYPAMVGYYRAIFGGLILTLGVTTLSALWSYERASWLQPLAWCFLGIGLARLSGPILIDEFNLFILGEGAGECLIALLLGIHAQRLLADAYLEDEDEEEE